MHRLFLSLIIIFNAVYSYAQSTSNGRSTSVTSGASLGRITYSGGGGHNNPMPSSLGEPFGGNKHGVTLGSQQNGKQGSSSKVAPVQLPGVLVSVYPNPSDGIFNVSITDPANGNYSVAIYNLLGQCITTLQASASNTTIDLALYPRAMYICTIRNQYQQSIYNQTIILR